MYTSSNEEATPPGDGQSLRGGQLSSASPCLRRPAAWIAVLLLLSEEPGFESQQGDSPLIMKQVNDMSRVRGNAQ